MSHLGHDLMSGERGQSLSKATGHSLESSHGSLCLFLEQLHLQVLLHGGELHLLKGILIPPSQRSFEADALKLLLLLREDLLLEELALLVGVAEHSQFKRADRKVLFDLDLHLGALSDHQSIVTLHVLLGLADLEGALKISQLDVAPHHVELSG